MIFFRSLRSDGSSSFARGRRSLNLAPANNVEFGEPKYVSRRYSDQEDEPDVSMLVRAQKRDTVGSETVITFVN